jgi:SsrA-binding protein
VGEKVVVQNRRARHDYHILERIEAGIELRGTEVKSLRNGHITLKDSYADVENGEAFLVGVHINPYEQGNIFNHEPERRRRLLMHKREILKLGARVAEKGLTLIPLCVYFKQGRVKVEIGLCQGKHTVDKRATIREREVKREIDRAMKVSKRKTKEHNPPRDK